MKKYKVVLLIMLLGIISCEKKDKSPIEKIHFDRDVCKRCVMLISDKAYVVQTRNINNSKNEKFDDIGCAVSWLAKQDKNWEETNNIWVKDFKTMKWIDAKKANWEHKGISPMGYSLRAYSHNSSVNGANYISFKQAIKLINKKNMHNKHTRKKHK